MKRQGRLETRDSVLTLCKRSGRKPRAFATALAFLFAFVFSGSAQTRLFAQQSPAGTIAYTKPNFAVNISGQDLWLINADGSNDRPLIRANPQNTSSLLLSTRNPVWSRDGQGIAFVGLVSTTPANAKLGLNGGYAIVVYDLASGTARAVAPLGSVFDDACSVAFSPNGRRLAYVNNSGTFAEFYTVNVDGTSRTLLGAYSIAIATGPTGFGIDWSPTEDLLVTNISVPYSQTLPVSVSALFLVPVAGGLSKAQQLTSPPVVFNRDLDQTNLLNLLKPVGQTADDLNPVFSKDGSKVAYAREVREVGGLTNSVRSSIRIIDIHRRTEYQVIPPLEHVRFNRISWSPDDTKLVFEVSQDLGIPTYGGMGLWVINVDGTGLRKLHNPPALSPSWNWVR